MKSMDNNKKEGLGNRQKSTDMNTNNGRNLDKNSLISKKDVDEFDLSEEYFTKGKLESDGEDF